VLYHGMNIRCHIEVIILVFDIVWHEHHR